MRIGVGSAERHSRLLERCLAHASSVACKANCSELAALVHMHAGRGKNTVTPCHCDKDIARCQTTIHSVCPGGALIGYAFGVATRYLLKYLQNRGAKPPQVSILRGKNLSIPRPSNLHDPLFPATQVSRISLRLQRWQPVLGQQTGLPCHSVQR